MTLAPWANYALFDLSLLGSTKDGKQAACGPAAVAEKPNIYNLIGYPSAHKPGDYVRAHFTQMVGGHWFGYVGSCVQETCCSRIGTLSPRPWVECFPSRRSSPER